MLPFFDKMKMLLLHAVILGNLSPLPEFFGRSLGVLFPFIFVGMWILFCFTGSRLGWMRFARAYPPRCKPLGRSVSVAAVTFGTVGLRYNSVVRSVATEQGLHLSVCIFFRAFHPPFTLPWSSIERVEPYSYWWSRGYIFHIRDEVGSFQMHVGREQAEELGQLIPHLFSPEQRCIPK
ncbi:MAG: hypothetical protein RI957_249 [Verrucomicrobiota bacterium]|jgi:hypothetical protein